MTIGIILTFHNADDFLYTALISLIRQTYPDWVCCLVNDHSTDTSREIAESACLGDSRFILLDADSPTPHRWEAVQQGYLALPEHVTHVALLDADDYLYLDCLAKAIAAFKTHSYLGVAYTDYVELHGETFYEGTRHREPFTPQRSLVSMNCFHFRLVAKWAMEDVGGFNTNYDVAADYDLILRLGEICRFAFIPEKLYVYRVHSGSLSHKKYFEQLDASRQMIQAALDRRGLGLSLDFLLNPRYILLNRKGEMINPDLLSDPRTQTLEANPIQDPWGLA